MNWPKDSMSAKIAFYGDPRGPHGVNESWFADNMIRVTPPWPMNYAGKPIKSISIHTKCATALSLALNEIWETCNHDLNKIKSFKLDEFGGTYNYRLIRGSSALSNHAFGIAIDIAPSVNPLGVKKGKMPQFAVDAFKKQGARWGGDYKGRKDWMHFEFVSPA